jgi:hypothetical protein
MRRRRRAPQMLRSRFKLLASGRFKHCHSRTNGGPSRRAKTRMRHRTCRLHRRLEPESRNIEQLERPVSRAMSRGKRVPGRVAPLSLTRRESRRDVDVLQRRSAGALSMGLKRSRMACSKHGALKAMACSPVGPNRVQTEKKRGVWSKNPGSSSGAACSADRQLDRAATTKCDGN